MTTEECKKNIISTAIEALVKHFEDLSSMCIKEEASERAAAYKVASEDIKTCLTGEFGWQLDLQEKLRLTPEELVTLNTIKETDGMEVHQEDWHLVESLKIKGYITLSGARGPEKAWKRAEIK